MEKLDRLGWVDGMTFSAYGLTIGIRTNRRSLEGKLSPCLPPGARACAPRAVDLLYSLRVGESEPSRRTREFHLLYAGSGRLARTTELGAALDMLRSHLEFSVAAMARRRVFLHAGVVALGGRALLLPGASGSGKSTLVASLVRAGATYYSDEFAVLDAQGRVHPFARSLRLRPAPGRAGEPVTLQELGGRRGVRPLEVGLVVLTAHRRGARTRLRELSRGQALLALLASAVPARLHPERVVPTLHRTVATARVLKGVRGEADAFASRLLDELNGEPAGAERPGSARKEGRSWKLGRVVKA